MSKTPEAELSEQITLSDVYVRTAGERLDYLRQRASLTLDEAAQQTGLSRSELSRLENGTRRLKDHHLEVLGRLYGMEPATLHGLLVQSPAPGLPALEEGNRLLPCYDAASVTGKGIDKVAPTLTRLPVDVKIGHGGYMIAVGTERNLPVPARTLVLVDPAARTVLGDLVVNTVNWSPLLMILQRNENGELVSSARNGAVQNFPKVIAMFSASHFTLAAP